MKWLAVCLVCLLGSCSLRADVTPLLGRLLLCAAARLSPLDDTQYNRYVAEAFGLKPKVGQKVKVWGIVRFDGQHSWYEIHPCDGWEEVK